MRTPDVPVYGEPDELLFHYTTADAAFRHILPTGRLRLRPYTLMRDPLEAKDWRLELSGVPDDLHDREGFAATLLEAINHVRRLTRLVSFTIDAPPGPGPLDAAFARGYARARMWEQYGDRHEGVCLCFRHELVDHIEQQRDPNGAMRARAVRYTPAGFAGSDARVFDASEAAAAWEQFAERLRAFDPARDGDPAAFSETIVASSADRASAELVRHTATHLDDFLFLKTSDWEGEHEFRIVVGAEHNDDSEGSLLFAHETALVGAILGDRFPLWQLPAAEAACAAQGVELLQMDWTTGIPVPRAV